MLAMRRGNTKGVLDGPGARIRCGTGGLLRNAFWSKGAEGQDTLVRDSMSETDTRGAAVIANGKG